MISFFIEMEAVAKGRPRFFNGRVLTDAKTRKFERDFAMAASKYKPTRPIKGPVELRVTFQFKRPKTVKRLHPSVRPDIDNYGKAVMDALKGFWIDDAQVVSLNLRKVYWNKTLIDVDIYELSNSIENLLEKNK